jgi:hypothetical protein
LPAVPISPSDGRPAPGPAAFEDNAMTNLSLTWSLAACAALAAVPASALRFAATLDSIKVQAEPGRTVTRTFQLRLAEDEQRTRFHSHVEDFWHSEDGTQSFYRPAGTLERSCGSWVTLNPVEQAVDPGKSLDVRLSVAVPAAAAPGGYWCALTVDQLVDPLAAPAGVAVQFLASISVGIFVYLPPIERAARVLDVELTGAEARVRLQNEGNAPLAVEGRLELLRPGSSEIVATVTFPRTTLLLEPANRRWITVPLPPAAELPAGRYLVRAIIDIGLDHYVGVQREMEIRREPGATASP